MTSRRSARTWLAVAGVRFGNWASRRAGRGAGTVVGGSIGLAIDRNLLGTLARGRTVIVVSGTNGKTTTSAFVAAGWGAPVATNETGSNMPAGHVAALVRSSAVRAVLECDEAWLGAVLDAVKPAIVVLLNLSRDQLDRSSEVRQLAERWRRALEHTSPTTALIANALDPLVVYAASAARRVVWCAAPVAWTGDTESCPRCTAAVQHDASGWWCECGFRQPVATSYLADADVVINAERCPLELALPGSFNRGNALLALSALEAIGVAPSEAVGRLARVHDVAGRYATRRLGEQVVRLLLAKNPAGFGATLADLAGAGALWIAINDHVADGHDPSWLYDVPFEALRGRTVWCLGTRRLDLATRLWYARVEAAVVDDGLPPVQGGVIDVIANYTAFRELLEASEPC